MSDREILADYGPHYVGEREIVNWTRPDGQTYFNVPIMYLREVTPAEYLEQKPHMVGHPDLTRAVCFWEVSVD